MTKSRKQSTPFRFFRKRFTVCIRKNFTLFRVLVACGIFILLLGILLNQHVYRLNLQDNFPQNNNENIIEVSYAPEPVVETIEFETEWLRQQRDEDYIHQALQTEEPLEAKYVIADEIEQGTAFPTQTPDENLMSALPKAQQFSTNDEDYSRYEEALPHDVIDTGLHHPKVRGIDIKIFNKPPYFGDKPVIAIVIDDMGDNYRRTKDISSLQAPITASFLTYPKKLDKHIADSLQSGHEIMLHVPMQPKSNINLSADILTVEMSPAEVRKNFQKMVDRFAHIKGINNHMGSRFTEDKVRMSEIMKVLKEKNLFFLDSKTTPHSIGDKVAKQYGVNYVSRNVFLDNKNDFQYILKQLSRTEKIARKNGYAVAIGHPKSQTFEALKHWLPTLKDKQIKLVPLSEIVSVLNTSAK